jgi:L-ascorbate metabolism protein UlaG (beta-lactamase superfamily)
MKPQHMNPEEAVQAHLDLGSETSFAIHHGTLQLTDEAHDAPAKALADAIAKYKLAPEGFLTADVGLPIVLRG